MKGVSASLCTRRRAAASARTKSRDFLTPSQRSDLMRRVKSERTSAEVLLRTALEEQSLQFQVNCSDLPGKPDIVFRNQRLAVFVDGEFWHGGQWRKRGLTSLAEQFDDSGKRERWTTKINGNVARDLARTAELLSQGWTVVRLWSQDIEKDTTKCVDLIRAALKRTTPASPASYIPSRDVSEFFAGVGLAHFGLEKAGWSIRFANDYAEDKLAFYRENFDSSQLTLDQRDIHKIKCKDVPSVCLATACFPCTDLSLAGAQRGLEPGTESSAYLKFTHLLSQMKSRRPPFVLLENVVGMLHSRNGKDFRICLQQLSDAGYSVDPFVLDAKWFVPHSRPRLFVVAVRNDLEPEGHIDGDRVADAATLRPERLTDFITDNPDLPWSLRLLPLPAKRSIRLDQIIEKIPKDDPRWWSKARVKKLYDQMSQQHRKEVRLMLKSRRPKYATVFRRMRYGRSMAELRTDGLAGCLRTPKGGSARQILFQASNGTYSARLLTPSECARLMGADSIRIPKTVSVNSALFAFGDGVCVPVVTWIANNYLNPLATELIHGRILKS